jgi:hypothetical protein
VTVIDVFAVSATVTAPVAVQTVVLEGYEATTVARPLWAAFEVVTSAPPPRSTFPAGQVAVEVAVVFAAAFPADVAELPITS